MVLLGILGTILKIIGIILLVILILLLVFLFVPLRYRIRFSREGERLEAAAEVSYFLRFVRLFITFRENRLSYKAKVLCFTGLSSDAKKRPQKQNLKKQKREEGNLEEAENIREADGTKPEAAANEITKVEDAPEDITGEKTAKEIVGVHHIEEDIARDSGAAENIASDGIFQRILKKLKEISEKIQKVIQSLMEKMAAFLNNIRSMAQKICSFVLQAREKSGYIKEFLQDEVNKNGIKYTGKTIFKLLKHVIPYKMKGEIQFGTGDAYSMGQILSVLGMFYPLYAQNLEIKADFGAEGFYLEGRVLLKGRIRFGSILFLLVKLWFQGKLKKCWSNAMALKDRLIEPAGMK